MRVGQFFCQAEIGDPRLIVFINDNIGRFEVAVQDAVLMRVMNGSGNGFDVGGRTLRGQWTIPHDLGQRPTGHIVHREEVLAVVFADLVDGHNVRMLQTRNGLGFGLKAFDFGGSGQQARLDHLQRHRSVQADLARLVHHPHAATSEQLEQFVVAEARQRLAAGSRGLRRG